MTGFLYISSNHPCGLGYTHATRLRLPKTPLLLLRSCNLLILVVRRALVRSRFLRSKTRYRIRNLLKSLSFANCNDKEQKSHNRSYNTFVIHGAVTKYIKLLQCLRLTRRNSKNSCLSSTRHLSSILVTRNHLVSVKVS